MKGSASTGTGVASLLGLIFIVLKLLGVIAWSWWWVLAPFWIPFALVLSIVIIGWVVVLILPSAKKRKKARS